MVLLSILLSSFYAVTVQSVIQNSHTLQSNGLITYYRGHRYVIYYHWLHDGDGKPNEACQRIANAQPEILFTYSHLGMDDWREPYRSNGTLNLTPEVVELLHSKGVKIYSYVATQWGLRPLENVLEQITLDSELGIDGVKIDEAYAFSEGLEGTDSDGRDISSILNYYQTIYNHAKSLGLQVMANTGTMYTNEIWMQLCDILGVEHEWREFPTLKAPYNCGGGWWMHKYPKDRFMAASSNGWKENGEWAYPMGYEVNLETGIRDTIEAWNLGFGWHYSCESWWWYPCLPDWFEEYEAAIQS